MFHKATVTRKFFHARECAKLVKIAQHTNCEIKIIVDGKYVGTTKSILSLLKLGLRPNTVIFVFVKGKNEREAANKVSDLLKESDI